MSEIWVYVAFDGDHIGRQVGQASLADNPDELRRLSQAIEQGNDIWRSWVLSKGGDVISMGGDEGRIRVGADHLGDLPSLRIRYQELVGAAVSVGVGTRLSEADKALLGAKLKGGDQICLYSRDIDDLIAKMPQKTEAEKLSDEYLHKAGEDGDGDVPSAVPSLAVRGGKVALNNGSAGGGMTGPSRAPAAAPEAPIEEGSEHSENESLNGLIEEAGQDIHAQLGQAADAQSQQDDSDEQQEQDQQASADGQDKLKKQLVQILKVWQDRAKELEALADQDPDLYESLVSMMKVLIEISKVYFGDPADQQQDGGEVQKSDKIPGGLADDARPEDFDQDALAEGIDVEMEHTSDKSIAREIAMDHLTEDPQYYKKLKTIEKSECKHFFGNSKRCLKCKATKDDLDKGALEAGKTTGRHDLVLPVGSQKDASAGGVRQNAGKVKVQHPESGKTGWVSVRAGQVLSQDGHAISSRNPGGK